MTKKEVQEIADHYGLTNDIIGYSDFESTLFKFAKDIEHIAFNKGILEERKLTTIFMTNPTVEV